MTASDTSATETIADDATLRRPRRLSLGKIASLVVGIPFLLALILYLVLLITPVPLPFGSAAAQALVRSAVPPSSEIELGDMALAVEGGFWPVLQFSPVSLSDSATGAYIEMDALEIGFSPFQALIGQPGATVNVVGPHIQIIQDLFGPRASRFEIIENPAGGPPTLRVLEGSTGFPSVAISTDGIALQGGEPGNAATMRSDNDWLIYNLESSEAGLADVVEQTRLGRFSRLTVRGGTVDMTDAVYGLYRRFEDINLEIAPNARGAMTTGAFSATLGGRTLVGTVERILEENGTTRLRSDISNIDFASFLPFIDDPQSPGAMRGAGAVSIDVTFAADTGAVQGGNFKVDLTGIDLRVETDHFPIASTILDIAWEPDTGRFIMDEGAISIGQSSAKVKGVFALGLDDDYGPTVGISMSARDVVIHPNDMAAPADPFESVEFSGWSAPLYGAFGIDRLSAQKGEGVIETSGRFDMLRDGVGIKMAVDGQGISADDLKRLWPSMMGKESRDWFVANITEGTVAQGSMRFDFPVGSISLDQESEQPLPPNSMAIDIVGTGVKIRPTADMEPIAIDGNMMLRLRDTDMSVSAAGGVVPTENGPITVSSPAMIMDATEGAPSIFEISGDVRAGLPALLALAEEQNIEALENAEMPIDLDSLTGTLDVGLLATIQLPDEAAGTEMQFDYVVNGTVEDFASSQTIQDRAIGNGQLTFSASQAGYQLGGTAEIDGVTADVEISGTPETEPSFRLGATVSADDLLAMGFDASEFLTGSARLVASPDADGTLQVAVDLAEAGLSIDDLGISKAVGVPGSLQASLTQDGTLTEISGIELAFESVRLGGGTVRFDAESGLESAEFSNFGLSSGDSAALSLSPISGGYALAVTGSQLDLKPMLRRFFGLGEGSGGVAPAQFDQALNLDVNLDRVLGYYGVTAFNVDMDLALSGSDLRRANVSANFTEGNALAITTNPTPEGRIMSMAFNDAGTIMRMLGVYSQLAGGSGSLVLNRNAERDVEVGELQIEDFAIVDEANVRQILGNHADSRAMIEANNRLDFQSGTVEFVRSSDRIQVTEALLDGDLVGGTMRGFIYTDQRQYDLTGTYVPLFGLNNAFQQIPLFGPLLGGRDGEGLLGVTFAVRGPLDDPDFAINPLSALAPGAFRELFEFQSRGQPQ